MKKDLSVDYVKSVLDYNPDTGEFVWKHREGSRGQWNGRYAGKSAGYTRSDGYMLIRINRVQYYSHRLAWLIVYGEWPINEIDHRDGNPSNNRISNIRLATGKENIRNSRVRRDNKSGLRGVWWNEKRKKWEVRIKAEGKFLYLGRFSNFNDASSVRISAEIQYFGEFRRG
jgi:hypothetical protein